MLHCFGALEWRRKRIKAKDRTERPAQFRVSRSTKQGLSMGRLRLKQQVARTRERTASTVPRRMAKPHTATVARWSCVHRALTIPAEGFCLTYAARRSLSIKSEERTGDEAR
jgi:hypothetical protein